MGRETKVIYYTNELEDEFSSAKITPKTIGDDYDYLGGVKRRIGRAVFYYGLIKPFGCLFTKLKYGHRLKNRAVLKETKGKGYFLYGNHTNAGADPFIPQMVDVNNNVYVIVHPNNVSMPVLGKITPALGALPLPDTLKAAKNFNNAIKKVVDKGACLLIYPEAHIWPYYTGIRPFKSASFGYPLKLDAPVFCFTNTYQKRRFFKTPRMVTYIDGPFYADKSLSTAESKEKLRNEVYEAMCRRSKENNVEMIKYVKAEDKS